MRLEPATQQFFPCDMLGANLPPELEASEPPEVRGVARDAVRMMVSYRADDHVTHARFRDLPNFLNAGDLLVINTSGTMKAAVQAIREDGTPLELHLSTHLPDGRWTVELYLHGGEAKEPFYDATACEMLFLPDSGTVTLQAPYSRQAKNGGTRLWAATLRLPMRLHDYLEQHGFPIRYEHVHQSWPVSYYQTVYATETGSAEMPSAGRAFTPELITQLVARGVQIAPIILHTGVASLEEDEPPYEEFYRVSPETARIVNATRAAGKRIVAVGTTVVRTLETVTDEQGVTHPGEGWTGIVITPQRGIRAVNGMLTGLHEPRSTHLLMLRALAGDAPLCAAYTEAIQHGYLWHEFGDTHLILP